MTCYNVYIGSLEDNSVPFSWEGGNWSGNSPLGIGPLFPPTAGYGEPFFTLKKRIQSGQYAGRQTDWGCWVAKVSKHEIRDFIREVYALRQESTTSESQTPPQYLKELLTIVASLDDAKAYGLVALES